MLRTWSVVLMALSLALCGTSAALAQDEAPIEPPAEPVLETPTKDWSVDVALTYASHYVWRGINLTDDPVFQPAIALKWRGFTGSVLGHMDLTEANNNQHEFTRADSSISYGGNAGELVNYSVGVVHYAFPNAGLKHALAKKGLKGTEEAFCSLGLNTLLKPTITTFYDFDEADSWLFVGALSHGVDSVLRVSEQVNVGATASTSLWYGDRAFNRYYAGVNRSAFGALACSLALPVALGERVSLTPSLTYSHMIDDRINKAVGDASNWVAAVTLGFGF